MIAYATEEIPIGRYHIVTEIEDELITYEFFSMQEALTHIERVWGASAITESVIENLGMIGKVAL